MASLTQDGAIPPAHTHSAHPFTCNTCQVAFRSSDLQRAHMQSDWHRYNLKRRVASLPPLTSEVFAEKVLANKVSAAATAARANFEKRCDHCDKTYYSDGAYLNHLKSQKHRMLAARLIANGRGIEGAETDSVADSNFSLGETLETASTATSTTNGKDHSADDEIGAISEGVRTTSIEEPSTQATEVVQLAPSNSQRGERTDGQDQDEYEHKANLGQCLFCNYVSPTLDLNIHHMSRQHSFFIPERDYLVDLAGLINFLSETVQVLHQCLFCHKGAHTSTGVQTHMRDRGHCMIAYSSEDEQMEVGEFYDFRSTYSDVDTEGEDEEDGRAAGVSLGAKRHTKTVVEKGDGEGVEIGGDDDEGWESESSLSSVPTEEITSVPIEHQHYKYERLGLHRHHSHTDPRPHKNTDGFHSHTHQGTNAVYHDDYELHLPSGRTAGHRSLNRYFRQNLRNYPSLEERVQGRTIENERDGSGADDEDMTDDPTAHQRHGTARGRQVASRANGGLGMTGVTEAKKREVKAVEQREQKRQLRADARYQWTKEKKGNQQKHFRDPLLQ